MYIPDLYVENKVPLSFVWHFHDMTCMDFIVQKFQRHLLTTAALFLLLDELLVYKKY